MGRIVRYVECDFVDHGVLFVECPNAEYKLLHSVKDLEMFNLLNKIEYDRHDRCLVEKLTGEVAKDFVTGLDEPKIVRDPNIRCGGSTLKGTRITVTDILGMLKTGSSKDDILDEFDQITPESFEWAMDYAMLSVFSSEDEK